MTVEIKQRKQFMFGANLSKQSRLTLNPSMDLEISSVSLMSCDYLSCEMVLGFHFA